MKVNYLRNFKKKKKKNSVNWIDDFNSIKGGPAIFFGNEFLMLSQLNNLSVKRIFI